MVSSNSKFSHRSALSDRINDKLHEEFVVHTNERGEEYRTRILPKGPPQKMLKFYCDGRLGEKLHFTIDDDRLIPITLSNLDKCSSISVSGKKYPRTERDKIHELVLELCVGTHFARRLGSGSPTIEITLGERIYHLSTLGDIWNFTMLKYGSDVGYFTGPKSKETKAVILIV